MPVSYLWWGRIWHSRAARSTLPDRPETRVKCAPKSAPAMKLRPLPSQIGLRR